MTVRGLQVGGTTTLVVDGDDFGKAPRLLLPFAAKQTLGPKSTEKQATFEVTLDVAVTPGYYHLRVVTEGGVSLPVVVAVDKLPQRPFAATAGPVPAALHGTVTGSTVVETTFAGKAGQNVIVEVESARLGSRFRPVTHLYSPKKLQLAWSWGVPGLLGDTRLETTLPEDGVYTVAVHDAEYAGPAPGFFRLRIGQWNSVDQVFPPVVGKDAKMVELLGPPTPTTAAVPATTGGATVPLAWPTAGLWSGPRPFVQASSRAEIVGGPPGEKPTDLPAGPVGVSGRLRTPNAEDRFRVPVIPGSKVRFEVFAERLRSAADVVLVVRTEAGAEVARVEDGPNTLDPVIEYAVPDKVTTVVVAVLDSQGRGSPNAFYRLTVDPVTTATGPGDFRLVTPSQRVTLPVGGRVVVPVFAERHGYAGRIDLTANALPTGVTLERAAILPGADGVLATMTRGDAPGDTTITTWQGRGETGIVRPVTSKGHPLDQLQPWLATELAVAPKAAKAAEFTVAWRGLPDTAGLVPAAKLALPVTVTRTDPNTVVRLTLLTSQLPPLTNNQPDLAKTIRPEKPTELAPKIADGEVVALLPPDLPSPGYDVAIQAELLTPDKQRVLATAVTPVRHLPVRMPIAVKLTSPARVDVKPDPKMPPSFEVKGEVVRAEGFAGEATVTLGGLPPGGQAAPATVKPGATAFTIKVVLPPTQPPGELPGLKLSASAVTDPKQPNVRVKSRDVELVLNVTK